MVSDVVLRLSITTRLADRREDFACHPVLELAGLGFVRAHDQLVETALGDDPHVPARRHTKSGSTSLGLLVVRKRVQDAAMLGQFEDCVDVPCDEPRFTVDGDHADGVGVEVEGGWEVAGP